MTSLQEAVLKSLVDGPCDSGGMLEASFLFPPEFPGFAGHFPGSPILPGIVQIMAVCCVAGRGSFLPMTMVKHCKFQRAVLPGEKLTVRAEVAEDGMFVTVRVRLFAGDEPCSAMTLQLTAAGAGCLQYNCS